MREKWRTRLARVGGLVLFTGAVGCGRPAADPPPAASPVPATVAEQPSPAAPPAGTDNPAPPKRAANPTLDAMGAGRAFVVDLKAGKPVADRLTPAFKSLFAEPGADADQAVGRWLTGLAPKLDPTSTSGIQLGPDLYAVAADAEFGTDPLSGRALMRLVKAGNGWQVDWLHIAPKLSGARLEGAPDIAAAKFAFAAFVDSLVVGDFRLAEAPLAPAAAARLVAAGGKSGAPGSARDALHARLKALRGSAIAHVLGNETVSAESATFSGALWGPGDNKTRESRRFTLTVVKGPRPGVWLADTFEVK